MRRLRCTTLVKMPFNLYRKCPAELVSLVDVMCDRVKRREKRWENLKGGDGGVVEMGNKIKE